MEIMFRQQTHSKSFEVLYKKVENKLTEIMSNGARDEIEDDMESTNNSDV